MLYSYLLTRSEFRIEPAPDASASADRRFAHTAYIDTLLLVLELSGIRLNRPNGQSPAVNIDKKLASNRVGRSLHEIDVLRGASARGVTGIEAFDGVLQPLADKIADSAVFTDYKRRTRKSLADDVKFWTTVISTIIARDADVEAAFRTLPQFTAVGMAQGIEKAIETLDSFSDTRLAYDVAKRDLQASLDKAYELYTSLLRLIVELTDLRAEQIETAKAKHLATADDLNPDMRMVDNRLAAALRECSSLNEYFGNVKPWDGDPILLRSLLDALMASKVYVDYMALPTTDMAADCEFWRDALTQVILPSTDLLEALEEKSVFWNDDLDIMSTFVLKTIRRFATATHTVQILPKYKDDEDAAFGAELFEYAVENRELYRSWIDSFIHRSQWDPERLAFMDIVIMIAAIAELVNYPAIPVPVTMNEFIEIANSYSTDRSGQFVNGILFSVVRMLADEGRLGKPLDADGQSRRSTQTQTENQ